MKASFCKTLIKREITAGEEEGEKKKKLVEVRGETRDDLNENCDFTQ